MLKIPGVPVTDDTSKNPQPSDDMWTGYLGNLSATWYSFMPTVPTFDNTELQYVQEGDEIVGYEDEIEEETKYEDSELDDNDDEDDDDDNGEDGDEEDKGSKKSSSDKKKKEEETTTAATTTTTAKSTSGIPSISEQDPNFASYGGDIEYVFPILTTTIPFDGEITVLGFHGFKGMFIY